MSLSAGTGYLTAGREIYGFANQILFADEASATDRVAFDFTSPVQLYMIEMQPSINTSGMAVADILSFSLTGNNLPIFECKFALAAASEPVQDQLPTIKFILPTRTHLKAIFNMQTAGSMIGSANCLFRGVYFG